MRVFMTAASNIFVRLRFPELLDQAVHLIFELQHAVVDNPLLGGERRLGKAIVGISIHAQSREQRQDSDPPYAGQASPRGARWRR